MATAYKSNSEQINALARSQQAVSAQGSANDQAISASGESLLRTERYNQQEQTKVDNWVNLGINLLDKSISAYSNIYGIIKQDQTSKANLENQREFETGKRLLTKSLYDGTSYWGTGEDGKAQFIVSPEVQAWADSYREKISSSKGMDSVRQNQLLSFDSEYESMITSGMETSIKQSYADLNANYTQIMESNLKADVASYVNAGGDLDVWNNSTPIQGVATIASRTDWSDEARQAKTNEYLEKVMSQGNIEIASKIALTQGNQAAWDWIYSPDRGYMTEQERQQAYTTASKAVSLRANSVAQQASDYMDDALTGPDSTMTAYQVYDALEVKYADEAPEVKANAIESAKSKHKEIMTAAGNNQFNSDKDAGLDALQDTYDRLIAGEFDGNYVNIEDSKATLVKTYKTEIDRQVNALASELSKTPAQIRSGNTKTFQSYQEAQKGVLAGFDAGEYDGYTAVSQYVANYEEIEDELEGDSAEKDYWGQKKANLLSSFTAKILDRYIPSKYNSEVSSGKTLLDTAIKNAYGTSAMTTEQKKEMQNLQSFYNGYIADWMFENGGTASSAEILDFCQRTGETVAVLTMEKSPWYKIGKGTAISTGNASKTLREFNSANAIIWENDEDQFLMYRDSAESVKKYLETGQPYEPSVVFASPGLEATFNTMAAEVSTQVCYYLGLNDDTSHNGFMASACPTFDDDGNMNLSPMVFDNKGNFYCIRGGELLIAKSGEDGLPVNWEKTGARASVTATAMKDKAVGSAGAPVVPVLNKNGTWTDSEITDFQLKARRKQIEATAAKKNTRGENYSDTAAEVKISTEDVVDWLKEHVTDGTVPPHLLADGVEYVVTKVADGAEHVYSKFKEKRMEPKVRTSSTGATHGGRGGSF